MQVSNVAWQSLNARSMSDMSCLQKWWQGSSPSQSKQTRAIAELEVSMQAGEVGTALLVWSPSLPTAVRQDLKAVVLPSHTHSQSAIAAPRTPPNGTSGGGRHAGTADLHVSG